MRILFLFLWLITALQPPSQGAIQIYANGHKYDSFGAYLASKSESLESKEQDDYIRKEAQQLGINVDFSKVKTIQLKNAKLGDQALHQLYVLSVEHGMVDALHDFYQHWGQPGFHLSRIFDSEELQAAINQAVRASKDPKFLISEPGKVRIMTLSTK